MSFYQKLVAGVPTLSYEFFPPKNPKGWSTLYSTMGNAARTGLDFVSVTYGAGGSTREKTVSLVGRIQNELQIDTMAHLTCVGHSRAELHAILSRIEAEGVPAIMALRGDPPRGATEFTPHPDGFRYGDEIVEFISQNFNFKVGCACYPEGHMESAEKQQDITYLKLKQDKGADFSVTQLFFDNTDFYNFRDNAQQAGVTIPLVAGIMPVSSIKQLGRFQEISGCSIPQALLDRLGEGTTAEVAQRGVEFAIDQCCDLLDNGVAGIHLYTLNKSKGSAAIVAGMRERGYFVPELA